MEELALIIEERRKSIAFISSSQEQKNRFFLIEEERKRNERQNWIMRVLKSLKMLSIEQKRVIFQTTYRMMTYYQTLPVPPAPDFESVNFLELMINLFVDFYNRFESLDFTHLKSIIRPNNNFIIVDLLKTMIDLGRRQFKCAMQEKFKEQLTVRQDKKLSVRSLVRLPAISEKISQSNRQKISKQKEVKVQKLSFQAKLRCALFQKYSKIIETCNFQYFSERSNDLYFQLLYNNQRNAAKIQKYKDSCFGPKKHINYDATGLYTLQEIKTLMADQRARASLRNSEIRELRGQCSAEQLKEYFKMQVQIHEDSTNLPTFARQGPLQDWFPLCLAKNGDKLHPFSLVVSINDSYLTIAEFQERYSKRIRVYMKQLLNEKYGIQTKILADPQYIKFPKKDFINYQNSKILDVVNEEYTVKEPLLPTISCDIGLPQRKARSETKIINKSFNAPLLKPAVERELEKRLNYSSILKEGLPSRRRIDSLIEHFVRIR